MTEQTTSSKGKNNRKWIILIVVALLVGGGLGYSYGSNQKEEDLQQKYSQQIKNLQTDVNTAKKTATGTVSEGQQTLSEAESTITALQSENAKLKTTVEEQSKKIADLEKQLEEAKNSSATP